MIRYYPDIDEQRKIQQKLQKKHQILLKTHDEQGLNELEQANPNLKSQEILFRSNAYHKTINSDAKNDNEMLTKFKEYRETVKQENDHANSDYWDALYEHGLSLMDLNPKMYQTLLKNPESMSNWLPQLVKATKKSHADFKIPETQIWTLPLELAQYLRHDYQETNQASRDAFNKLCLQNFNLDIQKSYFIKTGIFSSKFEFRNTHCTEPDQMGDYFNVINNFAMQVGAGLSMDLVVREWIKDVEDRPQIYNGMPLHTEFRSFIDCDKKQLIGTVPYWNPLVMKHTLQSQGQKNPAIMQDYLTYKAMEDTLNEDYNRHLSFVNQQITKLLPQLNLSGKWSLDVMKNGQNFYLIDMARMEKSALTELLPQH